ncbi:undecaprenyl-diphosphate phosphatase [Methylocella sp.]|uniref:undecaprenyl-diphosphate phosphatase n=1 Tax=Methylocella sp. TaxID=1978226 RepID=UPI0035B22384
MTETLTAQGAPATSPALEWFEAGVLGLVQGLTEFLPISSSAHLRVVGALLPSAADPGAAFTAITQIGTETAVLIYFRRDIFRISRAWLSSLIGPRAEKDAADARLGWLVILGTLPIAILGLLFRDAIEGGLRNLYVTATTLVVFALVLGLADRFGARKLALDQIGWGRGLALGFAQALALVPGVSRSGGTISAGLILGLTREAAARYSFLLAVPAVLASGFYQLWRHFGQFGPIGPWPTLFATLVAFVVGYAVIVGFLKLVSTRSYMPFVWYRLALGALLFVLLGAGALRP